MRAKEQFNVKFTNSGSIIDGALSEEPLSFYGSAHTWSTITPISNSLTSKPPLSTKDKISEYFWLSMHLVFLLLAFYFFMNILDVLATSCQLMSTYIATTIFRTPSVIENALVGVACGSLITTLIQSREEAMLLVVSLVKNNKVNLHGVIPIVMGINVGMTFVNIFVAFMQIKDKKVFQRAFITAALNTSFNCWTLILFLPIELITNFNYSFAKELTETIPNKNISNSNPSASLFFDLTKFIIQINSEKWQATASSSNESAVTPGIVKHWCPEEKAKCSFLFNIDVADFTLGLLIAIITLPTIILLSLIITNVTTSILHFNLVKNVRIKIASFKVGSCTKGGLTCMFLGLLVTLTIIPSHALIAFIGLLVSARFISIHLAFPFILSANISVALSHALRITIFHTIEKQALFVALCDLLFNFLGSTIFFLIKWTRLPLFTINNMKQVIIHYNWLPFVLAFLLYIFIPVVIILIAYVSQILLALFIFLIITLLVLILITTFMQKTCPQVLSPVLASWKFLPRCCKSLEPVNSLCEDIMCTSCFSLPNTASVESISDIVQFMESKPGESISVVMERKNRNESIFQSPKAFHTRNHMVTKYSQDKEASSSSEGTLISKYTPHHSQFESAAGSFEKFTVPSASTNSSVRILTPYSTSKFHVTPVKQKSGGNTPEETNLDNQTFKPTIRKSSNPNRSSADIDVNTSMPI